MTIESQKILYLFPGQGSQYQGIGSDFIREHPVAAEIYDRASEVLGYDMTELSTKDPGNQINLTRYTQPVLLTHSYACLKAFQAQVDDSIQPTYGCGHSLGEYSALVVAASLDFESALGLVAKRGELMGKYGEGEMLALPLSRADLEPWAAKNNCAIAACNLPEQTVAGGRPEDLDALAMDVEKEYSGKSGVRLKTEGAFHTFYMTEAARRFADELKETSFAAPKFPVASNYTGKIHESDVGTIKENLYLQLFNPVLYYDNLMTVAEAGVDVVIEFGGGLGNGDDPAAKRPNLAGTIMRAFRRVSPRPRYYSVINCKTLEDTLAALNV